MRKVSVPAGDVRGAGAAASYLLGPEHDARGVWLGVGVAPDEFGVEVGAPVSAEDLVEVLQGRSVAGGEQKVKGKNSIDLTFSAPKSVSVLWSQASAEQREEIERAMLTAVEAGIAHMTQTKDVVHRRKDGSRVREPAVGWLASATLHETARRAREEEAPAPQLHVHSVVVAVERQDGQLARADSWAMFKHNAPLEGAAIFRAALAEQLVGLGYEIESGSGRKRRFFEVRGVPRGLVERMSGRTREVEKRRAENERERGAELTGAELAAVATATRGTKATTLEREDLERIWRAQGEEFEFGAQEADSLRRGRGLGRTIDERRAEVREEALRKLAEQGPTVARGAARAIVFEAAAGRVGVEDAYSVLAELERSGELIALEGGRVTTREIRSLEESVMKVAVARGTQAREPVSPGAVAGGIAEALAGLPAGASFYKDQRDAVEALTTGAGWAVLTGRAGTGKGPALQAIAAAHRIDGWQVIACAADGTTAQRLGEQIKGDSATIGQIRFRVREGRQRISERTLIMIDEASKVGLRDWAEICRWSQQGARLVCVGHAGQMEAIELPGMFAAMVADEAVPVAELTEIRRHVNIEDPSKRHWLVDYQVAVDEGRGADAVAILDENDAFRQYDTREEAMVAMVADWDGWRSRGEPLDTVLVVHGSNADVDRVNLLAQERRLRGDELGAEAVRAVDREYLIHRGDCVVVRGRAVSPLEDADGDLPRRLENGQVGVVESVDPEADRVRVRVVRPNGEKEVVEIDQAPLRAQGEAGEEQVAALRLAYASHTFPVQGATVRRSAALAGHWSQGKEATYVADTRARAWHSVFAGRDDLGTRGSDKDRLRRYALRVETSQAREASIRSNVDREPRIALVSPASGRGSAAEPVVEASTQEPGQPFPDSITSHRILLGKGRAERLAARTELLHEHLAARDTTWVLERREELLEVAGDPFDRLDPQAALELQRLERGREVARRRIDAAELSGGEGDAHLAAAERAHLARIDAAELRLRDAGVHIDDWMAEHGERAARLVALERELAVRGELQREGDAPDPLAEVEPPLPVEAGIDVED